MWLDFGIYCSTGSTPMYTIGISQHLWNGIKTILNMWEAYCEKYAISQYGILVLVTEQGALLCNALCGKHSSNIPGSIG